MGDSLARAPYHSSADSRSTVMMPTAFRSVLVVFLLGMAGCAGAANSTDGASRPRARSDFLGGEELRRGGYSNLYELIRDARPRWLQPRGVDTISGTPGQVQVHIDGNRMGPVEVLRTIPLSGVTSIQFLGPVDAAGRFGLDHGHGAILVSTRPE